MIVWLSSADLYAWFGIINCARHGIGLSVLLFRYFSGIVIDATSGVKKTAGFCPRFLAQLRLAAIQLVYLNPLVVSNEMHQDCMFDTLLAYVYSSAIDVEFLS